MGSKNNTMLNSGFSGGIGNPKAYDEDCLSDIFNIFDFPIESLEGDGFEEDWNARLQGIGPIPSEVFRESSPVYRVGPSDMLRDSSFLNGRTRELKPLPTFVEENSSSNVLYSSYGNKSGPFQVPSPISVLSSSSSPVEKGVRLGREIAFPVRTRSKRPRRPNQWSLRFPSSDEILSNRKIIDKGKRKLLSHAERAIETTENALKRQNIMIKKCTHCQIAKTPQWREGPMGPKTLCNACGVRYRSGRLFPEYRPAASPTFVPSLHSNSHKKVIEMRTKGITLKETGTVQTKPQAWPSPLAVPMGKETGTSETKPPVWSPSPEVVPMDAETVMAEMKPRAGPCPESVPMDKETGTAETKPQVWPPP